MITSYEFPNQWNWRIFLIICNENENITDVLKHLKEKENCKIDEETINIEAPCFVCNTKDLIGGICINDFDFNAKDVSICVHELVHLMIYISETNKCEINLVTSECWAYFMGYMTELMIEILNNHFKEERK
jgi:hypothetical protein